MNESGFIVISRKLMTWKYNDYPEAMTLWIHILLMANWKESYFFGEKVERGEFITSVSHLMEATGIRSNNTIRKWLKRFADDEMIELKTTNRYTRIKVINYAIFQDVPKEYAQRSAQRDAQRSAQRDAQRSAQRDAHNRTKKQENKETKEQYSYSQQPPTWEEVESFAYAIGYIDPLPFYRQMENSGWTYKGEPVKDWRRLLKGFKRQQDMDRSKAMASHQRQTEHLPEYMKQPQPEPEGTDPELMAELLEWQRKNGGQT